MPLAEVEDDVFASGIAGQGIAVIPDEGIIRAPLQVLLLLFSF